MVDDLLTSPSMPRHYFQQHFLMLASEDQHAYSLFVLALSRLTPNNYLPKLARLIGSKFNLKAIVILI